MDADGRREENLLLRSSAHLRGPGSRHVEDLSAEGAA